nr:PKD domain-containing protein [Massilia sp. ST3]
MGGPSAAASGINDAGQVSGTSSLAGSPFARAFRWSKETGILNLGGLFITSSGGVAINNKGQVAGTAGAPDSSTHAFRWSDAEGMIDLGMLAPLGSLGFSNATAIGEDGTVAGWGTVANFDGHAFAWTPGTGMLDLGTLGGSYSIAAGVDAEGRVAGTAAVPGNLNHAFIWSRKGGMRDLGTFGGTQSFAGAISDKGQVVGGYYIGDTLRGFSWTRAGGMVDLGTFGGDVTNALGVNNKGQVVGSSMTKRGDSRAFVWSARDGMVDLNRRLRHAPPGLVVEAAAVISDNGSIVAFSNAGLVLLRPDCGCKGGHAAGPVIAPSVVEVGAPFDASVGFAGADASARHHVTWSFGDGSGDRAGDARASKGAGSATGRHVYTAPGIYTIVARVVDLGGRSATVSRTIVAHDRAKGAGGGNGAFMSPAGANRKDAHQAGTATFSFVSPPARARATGTKAELRFHVGTLSFRSDEFRPVGADAADGRFEGTGKINGQSKVRFTLYTTPGDAGGANGSGHVGLRIWHADPRTGADVVDYDNQPARTGGANPLREGQIFLLQ